MLMTWHFNIDSLTLLDNIDLLFRIDKPTRHDAILNINVCRSLFNRNWPGRHVCYSCRLASHGCPVTSRDAHGHSV